MNQYLSSSILFFLLVLWISAVVWGVLSIFEHRNRIIASVTKVEKNCFSDTIHYAQIRSRHQKVHVQKQEYMHNAGVKE